MPILPGENIEVPVQRITPDDAHYWFGYYDKCPWDAAGRHVLVMRSEVPERQPRETDSISLGRIDLQDGNAFKPFAETKAWCWQQGCMLQWLPQTPNDWVLYNSREEDEFVTSLKNVETGETRTLEHPTYCISKDGKTALSINFSRLASLRPGYGYEGVPDLVSDERAPEEDGIYSTDIESGESKLILPTAAISKFQHEDDMDKVPHWLNHLEFNPDGSRFVFIHRYRRKNSDSHISRLITANADGSKMHLLIDRMASHFGWLDPKHLLCFARVPGTGSNTGVKTEHEYVLFEDQSKKYDLIGKGILTPTMWSDGHCTYSPDREWILTDTYPDSGDHKITLILYHPKTERRINIGRFLSPTKFEGSLRCDLHPRFNQAGTQICFDSTHEGKRGVYIADVSEIVKG